VVFLRKMLGGEEDCRAMNARARRAHITGQP
jgi:hypothetical protein